NRSGSAAVPRESRRKRGSASAPPSRRSTVEDEQDEQCKETDSRRQEATLERRGGETQLHVVGAGRHPDPDQGVVGRYDAGGPAAARETRPGSKSGAASRSSWPAPATASA